MLHDFRINLNMFHCSQVPLFEFWNTSQNFRFLLVVFYKKLDGSHIIIGVTSNDLMFCLEIQKTIISNMWDTRFTYSTVIFKEPKKTPQNQAYSHPNRKLSS